MEWNRWRVNNQGRASSQDTLALQSCRPRPPEFSTVQQAFRKAPLGFPVWALQQLFIIERLGSSWIAAILVFGSFSFATHCTTPWEESSCAKHDPGLALQIERFFQEGLGLGRICWLDLRSASPFGWSRPEPAAPDSASRFRTLSLAACNSDTMCSTSWSMRQVLT